MNRSRQQNNSDIKTLGAQKRKLPKSLVRAAGLLKNKRSALERHIKQVRSEWSSNASR